VHCVRDGKRSAAAIHALLTEGAENG
jgi:hypothetical protein